MVRVGDIGRGLFSLALVGLLGCGASGPRQPAPSPASPAGSPTGSPAASPAGDRPEPVLERSTLRARGENPWELVTSQVQYDDVKKSARVGTLTWTLMDAGGKVLVRVEGQGADVDLEGQKVAFTGPVVARGARGEVLKVRKLLWDGKARKFLGSEGVRMLRQGSILTGRRMVASPDLRRMEVEGDVRVLLPESPTAEGDSP